MTPWIINLAELLVRIFAPDAGVGAYNDWRLVATTTLAPWILLMIGAALAAAVVLSARALGRLPFERRVLLLVLRSFAAIWVMILLLKPAIELRAVSRVRSRVALLVDASRSMGLATPDGTRAEVVQKHLADNADRLLELSQKAVIEPGTFGERLHAVEHLPDTLPTEEPRTDIARALNEISWQSSGRELGGVILYSDGADTEGLTVDSARALGQKLAAPIYAVGFSKDTMAPDLAIRRIVADDFAFVQNTVTLDVELEQHGLSLSSVPVTLKHDGTVIATKEAELSDGHARISFEFKPTRTGKQVYEVSVPIQRGEVVEGNNRRSIVLKVIRDRIRVLQVAGRPSWDERFLREFLKRNPNVDLISFFILRSTTDQQKAPQEELALIPFPVQELFTSELNTFDIVIYQNFTYRPYRMAPYLRNIRDYVMRGGGFMMVGGDSSFEDGFYSGTPIAEVLPIHTEGAAPWDPTDYRPRLTKEGRRHPITRIGEPGEPPETVFERLPALSGFNNAIALAPGAQALLVHPSLPNNPPVVAIREVGQGRTMSVSTDSLWNWRFVAVNEGSAGREFDRFWSNALRWLIRDPELARVRLKIDRSVLLKGDPVGVEVRVLGTDYRGLPGANVSAELLEVDGQKREVRASQEAVTGPEGTAIVVFKDAKPGTYAIRAQATASGERIGLAEEPVIVEAADVELQAPFPRPDILKALAEGSGGRYLDVSDRMPQLDIKDARRVEVDRTKRIPIWDTFPAFIILLGMAGFEWWLRRRAGLL
jgi:uncharacterized membrane protein